jgi:predicted chitinase
MKTRNQKLTFVKVKKYDTGTPEDFLRWRFVLNEKIKNHGYSAKYGMVMNLAQAMLEGCSLEAFLNE